MLALVLLTLLGAAEIDLRRCSDLSGRTVRAILRSALPEPPPGLTVVARCDGPLVDLELEARGYATVERQAGLSSPPGPAQARELALLIAETAETMAPAAPEPNAAQEASRTPDSNATATSRTDAGAAGPVELELGPSVWFDADGAASFGLGGAVEWRPSLLFVRAGASVHWGGAEDPLGTVRSQRTSGAVAVGLQRPLGWLRLGGSVGLRAGQLAVRADAADQAVDAVDGDFFFWGPNLTAHADLTPARRWFVRIEPEIGLAARGAIATAEDRRVVDLGSAWARLQVSLRFAP